jgi:hypothetical protein
MKLWKLNELSTTVLKNKYDVIKSTNDHDMRLIQYLFMLSINPTLATT